MYNLQFIWLPTTHSIINFTDPFYTFSWFTTSWRGGRETVCPHPTRSPRKVAGWHVAWLIHRVSCCCRGDGAWLLLTFCPQLPPAFPIPREWEHEHLHGGHGTGDDPGSAHSTSAASCQSCPMPPGCSGRVAWPSPPHQPWDVLQVLGQKLRWTKGKPQGKKACGEPLMPLRTPPFTLAARDGGVCEKHRYCFSQEQRPIWDTGTWAQA